MKCLLLAAVITGLIFITGCETENPVSELQTALNNRFQKNIITNQPGYNNFYVSLPSSGTFTNSAKTFILEILGNGNISGIGDSKIFSFSKINSNTQTGSLDITTSNGDRIYGSISGTMRTDNSSLLYFSGKYKLSGGTGRFLGVTGNGNYSGNFNKILSTGKFILSGVITQPEIVRGDR